MKKALVCLLLAATFLSGCMHNGGTVSNENSSIIYEIFPSSFYDSDGNGVGDLNGITEKLDYIQSLGAGAIWLTPTTDGASYHLYDVTDYMNIDPALGTMEDFERLAKEAEKHNIEIIMDLVLNHTSSKHPWFIEAKQNVINGTCDVEGAKCDWYVFSNQKGSGYTALGNGMYYESGFWSEMPDLNLDNEEVRAEIKKIVEFWMEKGVSGFRLDAVLHYYGSNAEKNREFVGWLCDVIHAVDETSFVVGEVWADQGTILNHYGTGMSSYFNFPASNTDGRIVTSIRKQSGEALAGWFADYHTKLKAVDENAVDSVFLSNHDQGRSGAFFGNDAAKTELMVSTMMFSPGKVFLYYGEEIGMLGSGNDPNKRLGMLWQSDSKEGIPFNPTGSDYSSQRDTSVADQEKDEASLLNFYRKAANIRNKSTLYEFGNVEAVETGNTAIYMMKIFDEHDTILVVHNYSDIQQVVEFKGEAASADHLQNNSVKGNTLTMEPFSTTIIYLKGN